MLILRCTQKLLKKNPGPADILEDALVPVLGNWHANLVRLGNFPVVVCTNDISLLPILLRGRDFPNLVTAFRERLAWRLRRLGVPEDAVSAELAAMEIVHITRSNSRSVLGSMNDYVRAIKFQLATGIEAVRADEVENWLSATPMSALNYKYPFEVALEAFNCAIPRASVERERA